MAEDLNDDAKIKPPYFTYGSSNFLKMISCYCFCFDCFYFGRFYSGRFYSGCCSGYSCSGCYSDSLEFTTLRYYFLPFGCKYTK